MTGTTDRIRSGRRVVVGFDGSSDAERGLAWAEEYAAARHLPVEVIAAAGDMVYPPEHGREEANRLAEEWLATAGKTLAEHGRVEWATTRVGDKVVPALLEVSHDAALIVIGAQGHGLMGGILLGSVSQHVTRHAHCPVVVVRGTEDERTPKVVVGLDDSDSARRALDFAFEVADLTGARLVAVHGRSLTSVTGPFDIDVAPALADDIADTERMMAEMTAGPRAEHPDVEVELLATPLPAVRALADASADATLTVVGTRGRGGFTGLLLGSVSTTLLHHATCPVAVVR